MFNLFDNNHGHIFQDAYCTAYQYGHKEVNSIDFLVAMIANETSEVGQFLKKYAPDLTEEYIMNYFGQHKVRSFNEEEMDGKMLWDSVTGLARLSLSPDMARNLQILNYISDQSTADDLDGMLLLCVFLMFSKSMASFILEQVDLPISEVLNLCNKRFGMIDRQLPETMNGGAEQDKMSKESVKKTPNLDKVSRDLSALAERGEIDPVIGRDKEIDRALQILGRRTKNNPIFVGEPGVGKTAIAEGIALKIAHHQAPIMFWNKRIVELNISHVVAGTKYRGEFEARFNKILDEVKKNPDIILFIDEIHMLIGAGGTEGSVDASNILKPALSRGEIQVMGATTYEEYQKYIEKDRALERRFASVTVDEPTEEETIDILKGLRQRYEEYHNVMIDDSAIVSAVKLGNRYISDRQMPDKAIDLIDEAASKLKIQANHHYVEAEQKIIDLEKKKRELVKEGRFQETKELSQEQHQAKCKLIDLEKEKMDCTPHVTELSIAKVVSEWSGVPLSQLEKQESERLLHLEDELHQKVIGQNKAVEAIAKAIRRARSGLKDPNRPIGSFMFLGPTGVGKTELAKALAEAMFGSVDHMIRVDMSEYMSRENVSRLIGSAPGYVGYEEGGQLTEKVRRHPYSVILFDEVEKAHPDVFNMMLQILDDGYITDAKGRKVDFKNTIIIMTSNSGATELRDNKQVGFGASGKHNQDQMEKTMLDSLKHQFKPEFLNRIDEIIVFHALSKDEIHQIVRLMTSKIVTRLKEKDIQLKVTVGAIKAIADKGYSEEYGARPLRRELQKQIEDPLAESLIAGDIQSGDKVTVGAKKGKIYFQTHSQQDK